MSIPAEQLWNRVCPICGGDQYSVLIPSNYPKDTLDPQELARIYRSSSEVKLMDQLVCCDDCGCRYLSPCLKPENILEGYADAVDPVFVSQNAFRIRTFSATLRALSTRWAIAPGSRFLDIGCAGGAFLKTAIDMGFKPTGVEPSRWMCNFARSHYGLDVRQGPLEQQDFGGELFDVVTLWDVLEHVPYPTETLKLAHSLLRPGGLLILTYPDICGLPARLMGRNWPFLLSVHLTYYTTDTIQRQLTAAGYQIKSLERFWQTLSLGYALERAAQISDRMAPIFRLTERLCKKIGIDKLAFSYYLSQRLVVSEKV